MKKKLYGTGSCVSIPTGSITVRKLFLDALNYCEFQFQLVRLQFTFFALDFGAVKCFNSNWFDYSYYFRTTIFRNNYVSIPTGSITVYPVARRLPASLKFQFQLVRLQCFNMEREFIFLCSFNSNWFDYSNASTGEKLLAKNKFQFQLVRLQSETQFYLQGVGIVSIPTGSITVTGQTPYLLLCQGFNSNWFDYSCRVASSAARY